MQYDPIFNKIINHTLNLEGGYVNNKNDKGGETKYGISKKSYPKLDIKNLTLEQAKKIYHDNYYKPIANLGIKDPRTMYALYDLAVNSGVGRAKEFHKKFGDNYEALMQGRHNYYNNIIKNDPSQQIFQKGWNNRLKNVDKFVKSNFAQPVQPQGVPNTISKDNVKQPELVLPDLHNVKDIVTDYTFGMKQPEQSKPEAPKTDHIRDFIEQQKKLKEQQFKAEQDQARIEQEQEKRRLMQEQNDKYITSLMGNAALNIGKLSNNNPQEPQRATQNPYGGWL